MVRSDGADGHGRTAVAVAAVAVSVPPLLLDLYMLWFWAPALSGPGTEPCDPAVDGWGVCWRPEQRWFWIVGAAVCLLAVGCLLVWLRRLHRTARWWLWALLPPGLLVVAASILARIR